MVKFDASNPYKTTCHNCGAMCSVPFWPNTGQYVYCPTCYTAAKGGTDNVYFTSCRKCGIDCGVPFNPRDNEPVYCPDCYVQVKREQAIQRQLIYLSAGQTWPESSHKSIWPLDEDEIEKIPMTYEAAYQTSMGSVKESYSAMAAEDAKGRRDESIIGRMKAVVLEKDDTVNDVICDEMRCLEVTKFEVLFGLVSVKDIRPIEIHRFVGANRYDGGNLVVTVLPRISVRSITRESMIRIWDLSFRNNIRIKKVTTLNPKVFVYKGHSTGRPTDEVNEE